MSNYREGLKGAQERLSNVEPVEVARNANVIYLPRDKSFLVPFMACLYQVSWPGGHVIRIGLDSGPAETAGAIVILHYLTTADGTPTEGKWITYRELWGGKTFFPAFKKRSIDMLARSFAQEPDSLGARATTLGGTSMGEGTYQWKFPVLPCIPMACTIWPGDEEVPGQGNILFDTTANHYLHTEDLALLGELLVSCLVHGTGRQGFKGLENFF
ncbi:MAG: DUF3786 domain-containing protein [Bacillota bacterium]